MTPDISHYRIEGELGRGGMGVVYRAVDTRLGRPVAIKVLPPGATNDPERRRRFIQEARSASALNHPNIVTIYEVDEHEGATFIAMELVEGMPLDKVLAAGPLPLASALVYATQIAIGARGRARGRHRPSRHQACQYRHRRTRPRGERDLAASQRRDRQCLDHCGWPCRTRKGPRLRPCQTCRGVGTGETVSALGTIPGTILGTASYMSPEQAQGLPVDARSDIFSFGAVVYEMLAGRRPFIGTSDVGTPHGDPAR